jgi:UDP-N-acetylglucosamine:LPS N-acetylglucosamine transferase
VPGLVAELLEDPARLASMREAMLAMARPHAADEIAEELIALAAAGR